MSVGVWMKGLRGRLLVLVFIPVVLMAGLSILSLQSIGSLTGDINVLGQDRIPITAAIGDLRTNINSTMRYTWLGYGLQNNSEKRTKALKDAEERIKRVDESLEALNKLLVVEASREVIKKSSSEWAMFKKEMADVRLNLEKQTPAGDELARIAIIEKVAPFTASISGQVAVLDENSKGVNAKLIAEAEANGARVRKALIWISITGTVALFLIGIFIASRLASSLTAVSYGISEASTQVNSGSQQLSSASQQLSSGATEAASSLEETVASVEELSSMVQRNAEHAREASALSNASRESAEQGEAEIRQLVTAMSEISQSSRKIEEIINVIDDIAFQTNLLALNAAVEAARAGEQGRGFAVVADAVRTLAQRSSVAAKDITTLIKDSVDKVDKGSDIADKSGTTLKSIVTAVKKVSDLNSEIASASQEQAAGIGNISKAMTQLDQATQGNAAAAEEVAASSEEMAAQGESMLNLVSDLQALVEGTTGRTAQRNFAPRSHGGSGVKSGGKAKVLNFSKATPHAAPEDAIPFEGEEARGKVGTTDGF